jgi:hypothetical protein
MPCSLEPMTDAFTLQDSLSLGDLRTYIGRAGRVEDGSVRLIAGGGVLAVYAAVLYPAGLLDESPTVLGLRTFALPQREEFDVVVPLGSLLRRIGSAEAAALNLAALDADATNGEGAAAQTPVTVSIPMQVNSVTWAAISPPRGGWTALESVSSSVLDAVAREGIHEVASTIPDGTGEAIVHRVRSEVWGRPIRGLEYVPAGAGFAALTLGFLNEGEETVPIYETGPWTRLTTRRGHVLIKRRAWTMSR